MPASWRQNGGGLSKAWFKFGLRSKLNSLRKRVQRGIVAASGFLVEQSQRPLVRSALLVVALAAVRKPIMQSATTALQRVFEQLERLTSGQQRVSAYQLTPQYNKRSLLSVLEGQQQQEHWQQKRWWQLWRANAASSGSSGREGTRKKRAIDVDALSRVQHQGWWDKLRLKVAHWKRGW